MRYTATEYNLETRTLDIFFSGCSLRCPSCHNEELWDSEGNVKDLKELTSSLHSPLVKTVRLMGGEPTEQEGLLELLKVLKSLGHSVWLFTGHKGVSVDYLPYIDYVKLGAFERNMRGWETPYGFPLASSNQVILDVEANEVHTASGTLTDATYISSEYNNLHGSSFLYIQSGGQNE